MQCFMRGMQFSVLPGVEEAHERTVGSDTGSPASLRFSVLLASEEEMIKEHP